RIAHAEGLRQPYHGVVDRGITMGVVDTHSLADDLGTLRVLLVELQPHLMHGVQNSAMNGFEAISNVGKSSPDDDRHRVVEIRTLHLIFNVDGDEARSQSIRRVAVAAVWT